LVCRFCTQEFNSLEALKARQSWHRDCGNAVNQKSRGPSPKRQTSREAGTQTTDQVNNLRAGLPREVLWISRRGVSVEEAKTLCQGSCFLEIYRRLVSSATIRFPLSLLSWVCFLQCAFCHRPAKAAGPLSVGSSNPRFS